MAWEDANELIVANDGAIYFAPVGSTLPLPNSDPARTPDRAFIGAGYATDDGVSLSVGSTVVDIKAWQTRQAIRREKTEQEIALQFTIQQWNETNITFAFGGGVVTGAGPYTYTFPSSDAPLEERAMIIDAVDGATIVRFVFPRGNVTENVESRFMRGSPALLPVTFRALEPTGGGDIGYFLTNSINFAAGS